MPSYSLKSCTLKYEDLPIWCTHIGVSIVWQVWHMSWASLGVVATIQVDNEQIISSVIFIN